MVEIPQQHMQSLLALLPCTLVAHLLTVPRSGLDLNTDPDAVKVASTTNAQDSSYMNGAMKAIKFLSHMKNCINHSFQIRHCISDVISDWEHTVAESLTTQLSCDCELRIRSYVPSNTSACTL